MNQLEVPTTKFTTTEKCDTELTYLYLYPLSLTAAAKFNIFSFNFHSADETAKIATLPTILILYS